MEIMFPFLFSILVLTSVVYIGTFINGIMKYVKYKKTYRDTTLRSLIIEEELLNETIMYAITLLILLVLTAGISVTIF